MRRRDQLDRDIAGLARLTDAQQRRGLLLAADPQQLDPTGEENHQSTSDRQQQQGPGAHGLARLWPLACRSMRRMLLRRGRRGDGGVRRRPGRAISRGGHGTSCHRRHRRCCGPTGTGDQAEVPDALAFSAPLVGGGTIDLADYAGKPVLLWFWAPT